MANSPAIRRRLFMHPAHLTVGLMGDSRAPRPYCRGEMPSTDRPAVAPMLTTLVADSRDADARTAMSLFQREIRQLGDMRCRCMDIDSIALGQDNPGDAGCSVIFGQGLQVARCWSDLLLPADVDNASRGGYPADELCESQVTVEIAADGRWHPILNGVEPFRSRLRNQWTGLVRVPARATVILYGRNGDAVWPVCWVRRGRGVVLQTTLGSSVDFLQPSFIRLALNALAWIGR